MPAVWRLDPRLRGDDCLRGDDRLRPALAPACRPCGDWIPAYAGMTAFFAGDDGLFAGDDGLFAGGRRPYLAWEMSFCSSPDWYISLMMSQPPTNSPFT